MGHGPARWVTGLTGGALASAALLGGCGGDGGDRDELLARLPAGSQFIAYSDLDAVRQDLDLPDDADPTEVEGGFAFAQSVVGLDLGVGPGDFDTLPLLRLEDADAIASSTGSETATVISTEADPETVATTLADAGFAEEGEDTFAREDTAIALGDGVIGVARTPEEAEALVGEPGDDPPEPFAQAEIEGSVISSTALDSDDGCLSYVVSTDQPTEGGEIVFFPVDQPDLTRVDVPDEEQFGEPRVEGDSVRVDVAPDSEGDPAIATLAAYDALALLLVTYDCDGE